MSTQTDAPKSGRFAISISPGARRLIAFLAFVAAILVIVAGVLHYMGDPYAGRGNASVGGLLKGSDTTKTLPPGRWKGDPPGQFVAGLDAKLYAGARVGPVQPIPRPAPPSVAPAAPPATQPAPAPQPALQAAPPPVNTAASASAGTIELRFGAFVVHQTSQIDDVAENRRGSAYYGEIRRRFDAGEPGFTGWSGRITLSVRTGGSEIVSREVQVVNGFIRDSARVPAVAYSTLVCMKMPAGVRIAHQQERPQFLAAGEHGACTPQGQVEDHVRRGLSGHALVIGIIARGQTAGR